MQLQVLITYILFFFSTALAAAVAPRNEVNVQIPPGITIWKLENFPDNVQQLAELKDDGWYFPDGSKGGDITKILSPAQIVSGAAYLTTFLGDFPRGLIPLLNPQFLLSLLQQGINALGPLTAAFGTVIPFLAPLIGSLLNPPGHI